MIYTLDKLGFDFEIAAGPDRDAANINAYLLAF